MVISLLYVCFLVCIIKNSVYYSYIAKKNYYSEAGGLRQNESQTEGTPHKYISDSPCPSLSTYNRWLWGIYISLFNMGIYSFFILRGYSTFSIIVYSRDINRRRVIEGIFRL